MGIPVKFARVYGKYHCSPPYRAPAPNFRMSLPELFMASRDLASQHIRGRPKSKLIPSGLVDVAVSVRDGWDLPFYGSGINEPLRHSAMDAVYQIKGEMRRYLTRRHKI